MGLALGTVSVLVSMMWIFSGGSPRQRVHTCRGGGGEGTVRPRYCQILRLVGCWTNSLNTKDKHCHLVLE